MKPALARYPHAATTAFEQTERPSTGLMWGVAAAIFVVVFLGQLALTGKLNMRGDLEMLNRFFDSDNAWYLVNFETGKQAFGSYGGRNFVHPNVANFVHPVVWLSSKAIGLPVKSVALGVAPVFAGLRSGLLFAALATAGFGFADALLATVLGTAAFSSILFGCLPESFVISGAFFAIYFYLAARVAAGGEVRRRYWILAGTLLTSVTITNAVPFALGLFLLLVMTKGNFGKAVKQTVGWTAAAMATTVVLFFVLTAAHGSFKGVGRRIGQLEEVGFNGRSLFPGFPDAIARSIVPIWPNELSGIDEEGKSKEVRVVRFTFRDDLDAIKGALPNITGYQHLANSQWLGFGVLGAIVFAVLISFRVLGEGGNAVTWLFLISVLQLAFHWVLHSFFGLELILYSQHWIVPLTIAICSGFTLPKPYNWLPRVIVLALIVTAVVRTIAVMNLMMSA